MLQALRRLFGGPAADGPAGEPGSDTNPAVVANIDEWPESPTVAALADEGDAGRQEFEAFRASFCHEPGKNFWKYLDEEGAWRMQAWLEWRNSPPEAKAFIRLMLQVQAAGRQIWDQAGINMLVQGRWSRGGAPEKESQDALSVLSQMLRKPIRVYYRQKPEGDLMVMEFEP